MAEYLAELATLHAALEGQLTATRTDTPEARKVAIRRITAELEEGDELLQQLNLVVAGDARGKQSAREWKLKLGQIRSAMVDLPSAAGGHGRGEDYELDLESGNQRTRLLSSTRALQSSSTRLTNSERLALENEDIAHGVLGDLRRQREQLEGTRDTLDEADDSVGRAQGTLKKMVRTAMRGRIVTGAIISVLVGLMFVLSRPRLPLIRP